MHIPFCIATKLRSFYFGLLFPLGCLFLVAQIRPYTRGTRNEAPQPTHPTNFSHGANFTDVEHGSMISESTEQPNHDTLIQILTYGPFYPSDSAYPYVSADIWTELVDNKKSFFLRSYEQNFPNISTIRDWVASKRHRVTLVINNQIDAPWPQLDEINSTEYRSLLLEPNLHQLFVKNPTTNYSTTLLPPENKIRPIPIGMKFNYKSRGLYSEHKQPYKDLLAKFSSSSIQTEELFLQTNRTNTIFIRPMKNSNTFRNRNYLRTNRALSTYRVNVPRILNRTAPKSARWVSRRLDITSFLNQLAQHRFMISPAGNGLDTHGTWEALLAGCIAIVPHSPLDSIFERLPVWLISDWQEVTDAAVQKKSIEMVIPDHYNFEKLFADWWRKEINEGL